MGNIVLLDDLTINKIAAGEVIERPASVIKEMVENSIDAGAKNITVEIKNGGISLIRITDDGCGIAEDDMEIAFERHATSKIRSADDLESVKSMGFRGEALASIAAIANVEMVSKKEGEEVAHKIVIEGGKVLEKTEAARSVGTTITVQKLFFNTPVRYKFLKKDYTEAGYIEDAITRIALINKDVAIKLINNGKTVLQTNGNGDSKTVIYSIYGKDVAAEIIEIDYTYEDIKVTGVIGKPVIARANRSQQLFFVNGRYIRDKNLTAAAEQSYKGMIPVGRYGFIILNLDMDPKMVDVNVHPAKLEVRFEEESKVFKAVYHAIKSGLANSELIENIQREEVEEKPVVENKESVVEEYPQEDKEKIENTSVNSVEENKVEEQEDSKVDEKEELRKGITGLFQRIMKEPDETDEEINNNPLEEIYKFRKELEKIGVHATSAPTIETLIKENLDEEKKEEIKVSEEEANSTRELDVENVNNIIKDKTQELMSTKLDESQATQIIEPVTSESIQEASVEKETEKDTNSEINNTQIIDVEEVKEKIEEVKEASYENQSTAVIDVFEKASQDKENTAPIFLETTVVPNEVLEENKVDSIDQKLIDNAAFVEKASKLLEEKLNFDNTQPIDTAKVRQVLKEEFEKNPEFDQMYKKTFGVDTVSVRKEKESVNQKNDQMNITEELAFVGENATVFETTEEHPEIKYKFLGIAFNTYIIIEIKDELYMIDQHAAHERIMYEQVKENYYSDKVKDEQYLLLPDVITLTHKDMLIAKENSDMFEKAGFTFEEFGENTIKLNSVPSMCETLNTKQLFLDILDEIDTVAVTARQEKEEKFIATVACKAAVKGKMKLDEQEVHSLMKKLLELPNPFTCPHGRPTAIKMTKYDMERKFSRK